MADHQRKEFFRQLGEERKEFFKNIDILISIVEGTIISAQNRFEDTAYGLLRQASNDLAIFEIELSRISANPIFQREKKLHWLYGETQRYRPFGFYEIR